MTDELPHTFDPAFDVDGPIYDLPVGRTDDADLAVRIWRAHAAKAVEVEREACAKLCEGLARELEDNIPRAHGIRDLRDAAAFIRGRGDDEHDRGAQSTKEVVLLGTYDDPHASVDGVHARMCGKPTCWCAWNPAQPDDEEG